ncbi:MAG: thymidine phosphorylase [Planctomycetota bacterium]|nr:thymidine phosphorylase [Planctomycetota bacterium]MEE2989266.1 thymidine phosphorylase [Planctomycetota bacterium]
MVFHPAQIIVRKRDGHALSDQQIDALIQHFSDGSLPDYQMAALAMAIFLQGMDARETTTLTRSMLESGSTLRWPDDGAIYVDKHSTGGIGDKISLLLAPLLACQGVRVPMISGRGLGPTGGTLDKLESIPGFRTDLSEGEIQQVVSDVGCLITGATESLAPADRKLYALRDVTGTVPSVPLITASILSKKLAASLDALVLDVKFGSGAFMKTQEEARALATSLVNTGTQLGLATSALITDMNQPLGRAVGNLVEVTEVIDVLKGEGPTDVRELTLQLAKEVLTKAGQASDGLEDHLSSGRALERFEQMVVAQGGNLGQLPSPAESSELLAVASGHVQSIDCEQLGLVVITLGGGRQMMDDAIDHRVGMEILVRIGDVVEQGEPLAIIYSDDSDRRQAAEEAIGAAIQIGQSAPPSNPLVVEKI